MSVALFLPLTFTMSPLHGIIFLISIYVSVGYGGALTAILLNTPGSPQNAVTTLDGFELTKQGRAAEALGCRYRPRSMAACCPISPCCRRLGSLRRSR